jgi:hypothetical protein
MKDAMAHGHCIKCGQTYTIDMFGRIRHQCSLTPLDPPKNMKPSEIIRSRVKPIECIQIGNAIVRKNPKIEPLAEAILEYLDEQYDNHAPDVVYPI